MVSETCSAFSWVYRGTAVHIARGLLSAVLLALLGAPSHAQQDRYVSTQGRDTTSVGIPNDCTNLAFAPCRTIGHALTQSDNFDVIKVATGVYPESIVFGGGFPRPITIEGGWGSNFVQRIDDPAAFTTIRGSGGAPIFDLEAQATILLITIDGFTLENGGGSAGGAIRARSLSESGRTNGGSLELTVTNCRIQNSSAGEGGGIALYSDPNGPGQSTNFLFAELSNNRFRNDSATGRGGALYGRNLSARMVVHLFENEILENTAGEEGGALALISEDADAESTLEMARNQLIGNGATFVPGGYLKADVYSSFDIDLENNIIADNGTAESGGGLFVRGDRGGVVDLRLLNDTFVGNQVGLYLSTNLDGQVIAGATNEILQDNSIWDVITTDGVSLGVDYSNIGSFNPNDGIYTEGPNVFDAPTRFTSPETGDYHLRDDAPEIDAGVCGVIVEMPPIPPQYIRIAPIDDFEGDLRQPFPQAVSGCDVGADEFIPGIPVPSVDVTADPTEIALGESSLVSWLARDAITCSLSTCVVGSPFCAVNTVDVTGSRTVAPTSDTLYRVECQGAGGTGQGSASVFVPEPGAGPLAATALVGLVLVASRRART